MIDKRIISKIQEMVYLEPRTVQEIARELGVSWKTAERYIEKVAEEYGTIRIKRFRGESKASVRIVYWNTGYKGATIIQEELLQRIMNSSEKYDFSPFDIVQYCDEKLVDCVKITEDIERALDKEISKTMEKASEELLLFSGNLSWVNYEKTRKVLEKAVKKGVKIKVITRIDITTINNLKALQAISSKISIKHREQPLRGVISDSIECQLKEVKPAALFKPSELNTDTVLSYTLRDKEWVSFLRKVFFTMYTSAPDTEKRMKILKKISSS